MRRILPAIIFCFTVFAAKGQELLRNRPNVALSIGAVSDTFKVDKPIMIRMTVTNNQSKTQRILIDKPVLWAFTGDVIDLKTGASVVSNTNRAMLRSQVYQEKDLKDLYYNLKTDESVTTEQDLGSIVIFNNPKGYSLPKGAYKMRLYYYGNESNEVVFYVN